MAEQGQKLVNSLGYTNVKVFGVYNTPESDQDIIAELKRQQWDAISFG